MNRNRLLNRYLLLTVMIIAMFVMSGCRTRITNNSEVSNVYVDEDGFLTETYQMRRDALGLSTAERPILPDFGSGNLEDDFDSSEETNFNYEPEEDTYVEPTTSSNSNNTANTTTRRYTSRQGTNSGNHNRSNNNRSSSDKVTVTLDPGEGTIEGKKAKEKVSEEFQKDASFSIATAEVVRWEGHKLTGWKPSDGSAVVSPGSRVKATKTITYTAVWDEGSTSAPETYTITFNTNGGDKMEAAKVAKGTSYKLRKPTTKENNKEFKEWKDEKGNTYSAGQSIKVESDMKLTAQWTTKKSNNGGNNNNRTQPTTKKSEPQTTKRSEPHTTTQATTQETQQTTSSPPQTTAPALKKPMVTFLDADGNPIGSPVEVENGVPKTLPEYPAKPGYDFAGWDPDPKNISQDTEIKPTWELNPIKYWDELKKGLNDEINYYAEGDDSVLKDCNGRTVPEGKAPDVAVGFVKIDANENDVKKVVKHIREEYPDMENERILIVSFPPKKDKQELLYKLYLYEKLYGTDLKSEINEVQKETGLKKEDVFKSFEVVDNQSTETSTPSGE